jgi:hypothetical protein
VSVGDTCTRISSSSSSPVVAKLEQHSWVRNSYFELKNIGNEYVNYLCSTHFALGFFIQISSGYTLLQENAGPTIFQATLSLIGLIHTELVFNLDNYIVRRVR